MLTLQKGRFRHLGDIVGGREFKNVENRWSRRPYARVFRVQQHATGRSSPVHSETKPNRRDVCRTVYLLLRTRFTLVLKLSYDSNNGILFRVVFFHLPTSPWTRSRFKMYSKSEIKEIYVYILESYF